MLVSLTIKNVVLIEHLEIEFCEGLCALTGETGAGKSILLDSLGLALGARSDAGLVRRGTDQASVTAQFEVDKRHAVFKFLNNQDIDTDDILILRRSVSKEGKSKAFINDQPVSANLLKKTGEMLVEIHGQFDTQILLSPQYHMVLLDAYSKNEKKLKALGLLWDQLKACNIQLKEMRETIEKARSDEEYYKDSLEDLDALSPQENEEATLTLLRERLMRREQIFENLNIAQSGLQDIEHMSGSVWRALEKIGEDAKEATAAMDRSNAEIQEVVSSLQSLLEEIDNNEYSLEEIDDRLFALKAQARKHGCDIDGLMKKREEIAEALNAIENQDQILADLIRKSDQIKQEYKEQAEILSQNRKISAGKLSKLIMKELPPLKLDKARFEVSIEALSEENWGERGFDKVEFLVATNPGMEAGALSKVASGGEMARLMLALKVVLAEVGTAQSLVFDEVDSGIGGATAAAVGERLSRLAQHKQILVVTHSPQVAAMASSHWIVSKKGKKDVTTDIIPLSESAQRQEEIARMLSGAEISEEARAAAHKLLEARVS